MTLTTRPRSSSVSWVPEGKHNPPSKRPSLTLPPRTRHPLNTGCMCMGFQIGRDSIFSLSRASRTASRSTPNSSGLIKITVSQQFCWLFILYFRVCPSWNLYVPSTDFADYADLIGASSRFEYTKHLYSSDLLSKGKWSWSCQQGSIFLCDFKF